MTQNKEPKESSRLLRKKLKRTTESRDNLKEKNNEKGKVIKVLKDRANELRENRDNWKDEYKNKEKENEELHKNLKCLAQKLAITEEQLQSIRDEFNEVKKKSHKGFGKAH